MDTPKMQMKFKGGRWLTSLPPVVALDVCHQGILAYINRGDHHNIGPWVCDVSTRLLMAMKQSCY